VTVMVSNQAALRVRRSRFIGAFGPIPDAAGPQPNGSSSGRYRQGRLEIVAAVCRAELVASQNGALHRLASGRVWRLPFCCFGSSPWCLPLGDDAGGR
jgi:hypothetical protein